MPTSYPGALDALTNPASGDNLNAGAGHASQHININDAAEAVQAELGINPRGLHASVKARLDESEGFGWRPDQTGYVQWNYDPALINNGTALGVNGTVYVQKLYTPNDITVANLNVQVVTAGATLTAGQNFAALYSSAKALLQTTADQSTPWASIGTKTMAVTSQAVPAGFFYVAFFANGTTRPAFSRLAANIGGVNGLLSNANSRWATADTGRTTTMPATLAAFTGVNTAYWCAVS